jgi:hypothetical protein
MNNVTFLFSCSSSSLQGWFFFRFFFSDLNLHCSVAQLLLLACYTAPPVLPLYSAVARLAVLHKPYTATTNRASSNTDD